MKRWWALGLAAVLMLSGCAAQVPDQTQQTQPTTVTTPAWYDQALSSWELPEGQFDKILFLDSVPILIGQKQIVTLDPVTMAESARIYVGNVDPETAQVSKKSLCYYDRADKCLYFLDERLQEQACVELGEELLGRCQLSADWSRLYYCTASGVHQLELSTGISRTLYAREADWQGVDALFYSDTVLFCRIREDDGSKPTLAISAEDGQVLWQMDGVSGLTCANMLYFGRMESGLWVFGWGAELSQTFLIAQDANVFPFLEKQKAVALCNGQLDCYELEGGHRIASCASPVEQIGDLYIQGNDVYFLSGGKLYCWDLKLTAVEDSTVYKENRYTADNPDTTGLAMRAIQCTQMYKSYGVDVLIWKAAKSAEPDGYTFTVDYVPESYDDALTQLSAVLAKFPYAMLSNVAGWTESGDLHVVLVSDIAADDGSETTGFQFLKDGEVYIVLEMGGDLERCFCHALGHAVDMHLMSHSKVLYDWDALNPEGFAYGSTKKFNGDYFIDEASMKGPVEDRATIFEYAVMDGNEAVFAAEGLQSKLQALCKALHESFGCKGANCPWEQYLD